MSFGKVTLGISGIVLSVASAGVAAFPIAYAVDGDDNTQNLYRIDLSDNSLTTVGSMFPPGNDRTESLSFGPDGRLYAVDEETANLITIDLDTANPTTIGNLGFTPNDAGLAFCVDNGTMYLVGENGDFYTVDPTNASTSFIGSIATNSPTGLACTHDGVMYMIDDDEDELYIIDRTNGNHTLVGGLGMSLSDAGLTWDGSRLLMVNDESPTNLYELNTSTGDATIVAQLSGDNLGLEGLAVNSRFAVPVPVVGATGLLALSGLLGLLGMRRFRR
ncbi:MAG: DUF6923 family protein [bacterium]